MPHFQFFSIFFLGLFSLAFLSFFMFSPLSDHEKVRVKKLPMSKFCYYNVLASFRLVTHLSDKTEQIGYFQAVMEKFPSAQKVCRQKKASRS